MNLARKSFLVFSFKNTQALTSLLEVGNVVKEVRIVGFFCIKKKMDSDTLLSTLKSLQAVSLTRGQSSEQHAHIYAHTGHTRIQTPRDHTNISGRCT